MQHWIRRMGVALAVLLLGGLGWAIVAMRQADEITMMTLAYPSIQPVAWIARQGLYAFHPTPEEVQDFNRRADAGWLIERADEPEARRLLAHYVAAGLDVNRHDLESPLLPTALHTAALVNKAWYTQVLLDFGARPDLRDAKGRTPLDLARRSQQRFPDNPETAARVRMLEAAEQEWAKRLAQPASAPR